MRFTILGSYYNNHFTLPPTSGPDSVETINNKFCPANLNDSLWFCPFDYQHIDNVISSSVKGFDNWKKIELSQRINFIKKFQEILLVKREQIINAISYETGRSIFDVVSEVDLTIYEIDQLIEQVPTSLKSKSYQTRDTGEVIVNKKPIGTALIIGPYSMSLSTSTHQIIASLLSGNSIILKPSIYTCYSSQLLIETFHEVQFPIGVVNLIQGDTEISRRLLKEREIKTVFFTGQKDDARDVVDTAGKDFSKLINISIHSKNFAIVDKNIDLDQTINDLVDACFSSSGQRFDSTSIVFIHKDIRNKFIEKFHAKSKTLVIDHPIDERNNPYMGPLINQKAVDQYLLFVGMAKREQFEEVMRGKYLERNPKGHFVSPSIHFIDNYNPKSHFLINEIVGPNCTFIEYSDLDIPIQIINDSEFGLVSSLFSKDELVIDKYIDEVNTGRLNINLPTTHFDKNIPETGSKNSGNYRPRGRAIISSCTYQQSIFRKTN